ncbi:hypothetical protein U27_06625 [Candidatus Vecturithrix granuli]|uniref:Uncharacterized protein n=1 Tax=Vecturithrix granuli TaxID=1499967 RepID=A0A081C4Y5_VECG1|nr:hypothetical protein U27_06625 [Candidatus Vecturithrix granuli]
MKNATNNSERHYVLAFYASKQPEKPALKVILRKDARSAKKKLVRHAHKKNIFMLESHG